MAMLHAHSMPTYITRKTALFPRGSILSDVKALTKTRTVYTVGYNYHRSL